MLHSWLTEFLCIAKAHSHDVLLTRAAAAECRGVENFLSLQKRNCLL